MATAKRKRKQQPKRVESRSWLAPGTIIAVAICILIGYVVVKRSDDIKEIKVAGTGIAFRGGSSPHGTA
jgi:hypothetical protein